MRLIDADELMGNIFFVEDEDGFMTTVVAKEDIESAPTVDAAPVVHGRWIKGVPAGLWDKLDGYRCSNCGSVILWMSHPYCQVCGAKMDKESAQVPDNDDEFWQCDRVVCAEEKACKAWDMRRCLDAEPNN